MKKILYSFLTLPVALNKFVLFSTDYSNPLQFLMSSKNMGAEPNEIYWSLEFTFTSLSFFIFLSHNDLFTTLPLSTISEKLA